MASTTRDYNKASATTVADSGATPGVGTTADPCHPLGQLSNKQFILPSGNVIPATEMAKYPFDIRVPTNKLHITPGVSQHSLLSTGKFADASYITVFDKEMVNVYNANNTIFTISKGAILCGIVTRSSTSTKFRWSTWCGTTTPTPSSSIAPQPSFYLIDPHPARQSTMSTN